MSDCYYIENIEVGGNANVPISDLPLQNGVNIIFAESDSGKTMITKAIFQTLGRSLSVIKDSQLRDRTWGRITFTSSETNKHIFLKRENKKIFVESECNGVFDSDSYTPADMQYAFLSLLGIPTNVKLISQIGGKAEPLTMSTILHLVHLDEGRISKESSCLKSGIGKGSFKDLSLILYLLQGDAYEALIREESESQFRSRVKGQEQILRSIYLEAESKLENIRKQKKQLGIGENDSGLTFFLNDYLKSISKEIEELSRKILDKTESEVENSLQKNELNVLLSNYNILESQYVSDICRLEFIAEGNDIFSPIPNAEKLCPFCHEPMATESITIEHSILTSELNSLVGKFNGLFAAKHDVVMAIGDLDTNISNLKDEISSLKNQLESLVSKQKSISGKIKSIDRYYEIRAEEKYLSSCMLEAGQKITDLLDSSYDSAEFHPSALLGNEFYNRMTENIQIILKACNYTYYKSARFDADTFDIVIGEKRKAERGQGYRSFFNTVVFLSFRKLINEYGYYKLPFTIIDSPTLGLDNTEMSIEESLQYGLFRYLDMNSKDFGQIIIVENRNSRISNIKFDNAKVYHFGRNEGDFREGFLKGYDSSKALAVEDDFNSSFDDSDGNNDQLELF